MQTNLLSPTDCINHFVYLSKCLPGLQGIVRPDEKPPEHQLILDLRHRIVASMNYYLDALKLPSAPQASTDVEIHSKLLVQEIVDVYVEETRRLREDLLRHTVASEHDKIKAAVEESMHRLGRRWLDKCAGSRVDE
jgi:hypothetical protein